MMGLLSALLPHVHRPASHTWVGTFRRDQCRCGHVRYISPTWDEWAGDWNLSKEAVRQVLDRAEEPW